MSLLQGYYKFAKPSDKSSVDAKLKGQCLKLIPNLPDPQKAKKTTTLLQSAG
jgi:hypothetical protein